VVAAPLALADPGDVVITSPVDGNTYADSSSAPDLEITNNGDVANQSCKLDNTAYAECNRLGFGGVLVTNGAHAYSVRTVDADGDIEVQQINFTIDDQDAPTISAAVAPNSSNVVEDPVTSELALDLSTDDTWARIYASIDDRGAERMDAYGPAFRWYPENVANGSHTAQFLVLDGAGNSSMTSVNFDVNDTTAPAVTIATPSANEVLTTGDFFADFSSDDVAATFTCSIDNTAGLPCHPSRTFQVSNVSAGAHVFKVASSDNAGNSATTSQNFSVTDSPVAGLQLTSPAGGAIYTAQPLLNFTAVDPIESSSLQCSINGGNFKRCDQGSPIEGIDANGGWTLKVRAKNDNGDQVSDTAVFTVNDTTAPTVQSTTPPGPVSDIADFYPDFLITDTFADGSPSISPDASCQINSGPTADCLSLLYFNTDPAYVPGPTTIKVTASDWVGNAASGTASFDITDVTAPDVQIVSPVANQIVADDSITVDFVATGGAIKFECQIDAGPRQSCHDGDNDGFMSWSPSDLPAGPITFHVYATDNAGNTGTAAVTVDNTDTVGPTLEFVTPDAGATLSDNVSAHVISGEQIFKLRCGVGATAASLATDETACHIDRFDKHTATFRPGSIAAGPQTLWIEASDDQGNPTVISRAIIVADTTAPDLFFDGFDLDGGETSFDSPRTFGYSSSDGSAHFTCAFDGDPAVACGAGGYGTFDLEPSANVSHTIVVQAIDPSGNTTQKSVSYTVNDTLPPELFIHGVVAGQAVGTSVISTLHTHGAVSTDCAIDAAAFAPCLESGWTANLTTSGAHTLRYRATDAAGNSIVKSIAVVATVPTPPVDPPVDPPVVPPAPPVPAPPVLPAATISIAKLKPKVTKKTVTIPIAVAVTLPAGVDAKSACSGKAAIALSVGKKTLKKSSAALKIVKNKCTIAATLKLKTKDVAGKKFSVGVTFTGNVTIAKFYGAKQGSSGRPK
jgi:hypothetical protein